MMKREASGLLTLVTLVLFLGTVAVWCQIAGAH